MSERIFRADVFCVRVARGEGGGNGVQPLVFILGETQQVSFLGTVIYEGRRGGRDGLESGNIPYWISRAQHLTRSLSFFFSFSLLLSNAGVQILLGEVVTATLRELEELREQGEAELASVVGSDQAHTARIRCLVHLFFVFDGLIPDYG